jgi:hypothetical protein
LFTCSGLEIAQAIWLHLDGQEMITHTTLGLWGREIWEEDRLWLSDLYNCATIDV